MNGPSLERTLRELEPEEENLLAAFAWCEHASDGVERGMRLVSSAYRMWSILGRFGLGRRLLEESLARDRERRPTAVRAKALTRLAGFATTVSDHDTARPALEEGLEIVRALGDRRGEARALAGLSVVAMFQDRLEDALTLGEQSLALYQALGEKRGVAMTTYNLGSIEEMLHRPDHGRARLERARDLLREIRDEVTLALCHAGLAAALTRLGELDAATRELREALTTLARIEAPRESVFALESAVEWLIAHARMPEAARILGAAEGLRESLSMPPMPSERADLERAWRRLREALGDTEVDRAAAGGRLLPRDRSIEELRALMG